MAWFLHGLLLHVIVSIIDNDYQLHVVLLLIIISPGPGLLLLRIISNWKGGRVNSLASGWIFQLSSDGK